MNTATFILALAVLLIVSVACHLEANKKQVAEDYPYNQEREFADIAEQIKRASNQQHLGFCLQRMYNFQRKYQLRDFDGIMTMQRLIQLLECQKAVIEAQSILNFGGGYSYDAR